MTNRHPMPGYITPRSIVLAGYAGDESAVRAGLGNPDGEIRARALTAAARLNTASCGDIQRLLNDSEVGVRRVAAEVASRHDTADPRLGDLVESLVHGLNDDSVVAEVCAFSLGELGVVTPSVVWSLKQVALGHEDSLCRESAVAALGALHQAPETILAALSDKATVRRRAVIALAPFEGDDIDAALRTALEDRDWQVRQAAEDLLA